MTEDRYLAAFTRRYTERPRPILGGSWGLGGVIFGGSMLAGWLGYEGFAAGVVMFPVAAVYVVVSEIVDDRRRRRARQSHGRLNESP